MWWGSEGKEGGGEEGSSEGRTRARRERGANLGGREEGRCGKRVKHELPIMMGLGGPGR